MNLFDITEIENLVSTELRKLGFPRVWNNRPKAIDDKVDDFVVVKVSGGVSDKVAFGTTRIAVYLYVRDVLEVKNSKKLSLMHKKLAGLPLWIEPEEPSENGGGLLINGNARVVGDTADDFGFHCRIISYHITIKSA